MNAPSEGKGAGHAGGPDGLPPLILAVDDEADLRAYLEKLLGDQGYRVRTCASPDEALHFLELSAPDLILSDITMPGMTGLELFARVQSLSDRARTPFLFLTALQSEEDVDRGLELGADDYITKPVQKARLLATIRGKLLREESRRTLLQSEQTRMRIEILNLLSHEFNTPLTCIQGVASILLDDKVELGQEKLQHFVRILKAGGDRLQRLVNAFMEVSRQRSGYEADAFARQVELQPLAPFLLEARRTWAGRAKEKELALEVDLVDPSAMARVLPRQLRRALDEIVHNAIRFSAEGGPPVRLSLGTDGESARIAVTDGGRGIAAEHLSRVTEVFYQVDRHKQEQQGPGLGLAIADGYARIHGGHLRLLQRPGGPGIRCELVLPLVPA